MQGHSITLSLGPSPSSSSSYTKKRKHTATSPYIVQVHCRENLFAPMPKGGGGSPLHRCLIYLMVKRGSFVGWHTQQTFFPHPPKSQGLDGGGERPRFVHVTATSTAKQPNTQQQKQQPWNMCFLGGSQIFSLAFSFHQPNDPSASPSLGEINLKNGLVQFTINVYKFGLNAYKICLFVHVGEIERDIGQMWP